jgi:hypothetical protein
MKVNRSNDTELAVYRIPRTCLPKAPDTLRAKGGASYGLFSSDETALTPRVLRG